MKFSKLEIYKDDKGRYTVQVLHDGEWHVFYGNSLRSAMKLVVDFMVEKERQS